MDAELSVYPCANMSGYGDVVPGTRGQSGAPTRALVTGATGFAGQHLVELLLRETDWHILGFGRTASNQHHARYQFCAGDISSDRQIREVLAEGRPEYVFHLAAATPPAPDAHMHAVNVGGTANLLEAVYATSPQARVLIVGSDAQYGALPSHDVPTPERAPQRPVGAYGRSKALQEQVALQFRKMTSLQVVCVRPFNHIGPGQSERFVVASLARQIASAEAGIRPSTIQLGRTDTMRDFTDVRDVVRAYLACARLGEDGAVYNVGSGRSSSIAEIADRLAAFATCPMTFTSVEERARPGDVLRTECDASAVRTRTGWEPRIPLEQTLRDTLEYWRTQLHGSLTSQRGTEEPR